MKMKLVEFLYSRNVHFECKVDSKNKKAPYDIILGADFMSALKIQLDYKLKKITWERISIPMKTLGALALEAALETIYFANTQHLCYKKLKKDTRGSWMPTIPRWILT